MFYTTSLFVQWSDGSGVVPPVVVSGPSVTPGRIGILPGQVRREDQTEKVARRLREALEDAPAVKIEQADEYFGKSAKLAQAISIIRGESADIRARIAELQAQEQARITQAARTKLESQLLRATQSLQMAQLQETILIEEMEILDIAYFGLIGIMVMQ